MTHHHACDCREYAQQQEVAALRRELEDTVTECMAEKSNNDIRQARIDELEAKVAELEAEQKTSGLTERERWLMKESWKARDYYTYFEEWIDDRVDDCGHTVGELLAAQGRHHATAPSVEEGE